MRETMRPKPQITPTITNQGNKVSITATLSALYETDEMRQDEMNYDEL